MKGGGMTVYFWVINDPNNSWRGETEKKKGKKTECVTNYPTVTRGVWTLP